MQVVKVGSIPLTPIWREGLLGVELAALLRHDVFRNPPETPESLPVMLVPGFLTGDAQLGVLSAWLRRCGHRTHTSGIWLNADCSAASTARLEERLEEFADREGEPVTLIGQSRGGLFARVLGVRRPDLVRSVVTLGSPHRDPLAVHPLIWAQCAAIAGLAALGVPGLASHKCRNGGCCARFSDDLAGPFPERIRFLSIYSRKDGIVDWEACLDRDAAHAEVHSTHCGMGLNPAVYRILESELSDSCARTVERPATARAAAA